jgi:hypothetical protein
LGPEGRWFKSSHADSATIEIPLRRRGVVVAHAIVDAADAHLAHWRWKLDSRGYAARTDGADRCRMLLMHRVVMGCERGDGFQVDHLDHNKLNNTRANLRVVTQAENQRNRLAANSTSKTGLRGVYRAGAKFKAEVCCEHGRFYLGCFETPELAYAAAEKKRLELGYMPTGEVA